MLRKWAAAAAAASDSTRQGKWSGVSSALNSGERARSASTVSRFEVQGPKRHGLDDSVMLEVSD